MAAGKVVAKKCVKRKSGHLYFVDGQGNVRETPMKKRHAKKRAKKKHAKKKR